MRSVAVGELAGRGNQVRHKVQKRRLSGDSHHEDLELSIAGRILGMAWKSFLPESVEGSLGSRIEPTKPPRISRVSSL